MNAIFQNITHALGWSIVHSLWQGVLIYCLLCLVYVALPKSSAKNKYIMALCAQASIFFCFVATFVHYLDFSRSALSSSPIDFTTEQLLDIQASTHILHALEPMFPWFASLYVIGLLIQMILFTNSFSKLHYLKTRGLQDAPSLWQESFQRISATLTPSKKVRFFLSEKVSVPLTLGHVKPIILFPIALVTHLDLKQVESILIHELAHIKRNDYLFNLFKVIMETVLFFNPFIWLLSKHIEAEREHACDDMVVKWVPSPIAYAQALMSVELNSHHIAPAYAMAATGKNHHLLHRIKRITKMEKNYINVKQHLIALLLSSVALVTVAWIAPQNKEQQPAENPAIISLEQMEELELLPMGEAVSEELTAQICDTTEINSITLAPLDTIQPLPTLAPIDPIAPIALQKEADVLQQRMQTPEWKEHIAQVEANAKRIEAYYNSPAWKEHIAKIAANSKRIEEYYNSPAWKEQIAKIETNAKRVEEFYNSPKWKEHIAKVEENAKRVEEYYNSPEWKEHIAKIENNSKRIEEYYNSPEWKDKIAKIEENARKVEEYYNSPEWKEKISKIEENAKQLTEYYNSPAWKEKSKQLTAPQNDNKNEK
ncbi:M56 family metallopeptidase [Sphingobacterium bambusae]|uniref:M56 family metallopeptidase n=1 Tax=Sphingobacterium bambusae TaxID=662858 RepID=A0ABW6BL14_9SPHI|nr:M56 family metallopeptidase [Sphingobacterium bambusae]WPL46743.1 M56 family metallopeptidase [Sphingobacterium bambusae]